MGEAAKTIYFNEAATSWPKAPGVAEAITAALAHPAACPGRAAGLGTDVLRDCRRRLAAILDVPHPSRIVLTMNATHALNLAIMGFPFEEGAHVITTCLEHNSVLRPLHQLCQQGRIRLTIVGLDGEGEFDRAAYLAALSEGASLVAISHASNVTGGAVEVAPLFALAQLAGAWTLLDASQSIGHVPVRPSELQADMVAFPGHKGLRGPSGTGGLYVAPEVELHPVLTGGTGTLSEQLLHPSEMPQRLEAGTPNALSFAGLNAALDWWSEKGDGCVREGHRLGEQLRRGLREIAQVRVCSGRTGAVRRCPSPRSRSRAGAWKRRAVSSWSSTGYTAGQACTVRP